MTLATPKQCCRCEELKATTEFYANRKAAGGFASHCKDCQKIYRREHSRKAWREGQHWNQRNPEKWRAQKKVSRALKVGRITQKERCEDCDERAAAHAHHEDYNRPLDVAWLCTACHTARHAQPHPAADKDGGGE